MDKQVHLRSFLFDLLAIVLFAILARAAHNSPELPFSITGIADSMWPFLIGVCVAWALRRPPHPALVWVLAVVSGLSIWAVRHQAVPHISFIIVASVMSALLLFGWRGIAKLAARR